MKPIVRLLLSTITERGLKIPAAAIQLGIPKERIYKWKEEGTEPKAEDQKKINEWLNSDGKESPNMDQIIIQLRCWVAILAEEISRIKADKSGLSSLVEMKRLEKSVKDYESFL